MDIWNPKKPQRRGGANLFSKELQHTIGIKGEQINYNNDEYDNDDDDDDDYFDDDDYDYSSSQRT